MLGDFVKLITTAGTGEDNKIYQYTSGDGFKAVALNENKVFILWGADDNTLCSVVCDINNQEILPGEICSILYSNNAGKYNSFNLVKLTENTVFIKYNNYTSNNFLAYGVVCTISGRNILLGTRTQISNKPYSGYGSACAKLSENKLLLISGNYGTLFAVICTINETEVQIGEQVSIGMYSTSSTISSVSITILNENKAIITCVTDNDKYLKSVALNINNETITLGNITLISNQKILNSLDKTIISTIKISQNKFLILWSTPKNTSGSAYIALYGCICDIEGLVITAGNPIKLHDSEISNYSFNGILISKNIVQILYSSSSTEFSRMICSINELMITITSNETIKNDLYTGSKNGICALVLNPNKSLIIYNKNSYGIAGYIENLETTVSTLEDEYDIILGVAQQTGTAGQLIKVVVPNRKKEEN